MNRDQKRRDEILEPYFRDGDYRGGIRSFRALTLQVLEELIAADFISLDEAQNNSPTVFELANFMRQHPGMTAHGYAVAATRDDYRATLEGLEFNGAVSRELERAFVREFHHADELTVEDNCLHAWWD